MGASAAFALPSKVVADAVLRACTLDVTAFKPGNVSVESPGHGMSAEDFLASARAVHGVIGSPALSVGQRILRSVEVTQAAVGCNTNLGIVLLVAPLAHAALASADAAALGTRVRDVLRSLDIDDADQAFRAIRLAQPAGLGTSARHDVRAAPKVTLLEAMREASARDRIAYQYANGFVDVFGLGVAAIRRARIQWSSDEWATMASYLRFLARYPDTHVARKHGPAVAEAVRREAAYVLRAVEVAEHPRAAHAVLMDFDRTLKARGINPGTSADLTVASLLATELEDSLESVYHAHPA